MEGVKVAEWLEAGKVNKRDMSNRREKRTIPDSEKDDKYWEKRKRNNLAAKRSRENKRFMEMSTKKKADILEKENALLKREIEILKTKFGLPLDKCFLTEEEKEAVNLDWQRNYFVKQETDSTYSDEDSKSSYPVSLIRNESLSSHNDKFDVSSRSESDSCDSGGHRITDDRNAKMPFYGMLLAAAAMPGYGEHGLHQTSPFPYYLPYGVSSQQTSLNPATKKSETKDNRRQNGVHPYVRSQNKKNEDDSDLKMKLMHLSAQVDEMKNRFIKIE